MATAQQHFGIQFEIEIWSQIPSCKKKNNRGGGEDKIKDWQDLISPTQLAELTTAMKLGIINK